MEEKKRVLVYMRDGSLKKTGGPAGYNYALKTQLDKMGVDYIEYIHKEESFSSKANNIGKDIKATWYGQILKSVKDLFRWTINLYSPFAKSEIDLSGYDIVHFHTTLAMYYARQSLKKYKGKVILTSHSPSVLSKEIFEMLTPWNQKYMKWYFKHLVRFDRYAFKRADYIVFPCPEAEEPYYNSWNEYAKIKEEKKDSYRYLLTGTYQCNPILTREEICNKYNIPTNAFIVCYVGRHNRLKGYDNLKKIAKEVLENNPNVYFLIAGAEYPMTRLNHPRWIEAGWTNDPHSIIGASDVFVLPNQETYFDLIMLEVLSLGKIVVGSRTGGNKHFEKVGTQGVLLYDSLADAVFQINKIIGLSSDERKKLGESNACDFRNNYSLEVFGQNYIDLVNRILSDPNDLGTYNLSIKNRIRNYWPISWILQKKKEHKDRSYAKLRAPYIPRLRELIDNDTSIISSNCFAGRVMQDLEMQYNSPTLGLYIWYPDYIEFLSNLKYYLTEAKLEFVKHSKYPLGEERRKNWKHWYPIALLGGKVEIQFLHYHTEKEAAEKWYRRAARINWDKLLVIGMEQNLCTEDCIEKFDVLPFEKKVFFGTKDRKDLKSHCFLSEFEGFEQVGDPYKKGDIFYRELVKYFNHNENFNNKYSKNR